MTPTSVHLTLLKEREPTAGLTYVPLAATSQTNQCLLIVSITPLTLKPLSNFLTPLLRTWLKHPEHGRAEFMFVYLFHLKVYVRFLFFPSGC